MTDEKLPGNSYTQKSQAKSPKNEAKREAPAQIVQGKVIQKRPNAFKRFFLHEDAKTIGSYVVEDVILPAIKNMLFDSVNGGLSQALFGSDRRQNRARTVGGYTQYNRMYPADPRNAEKQSPRQISQRARSTHNFDEIILEHRGEAESILDSLGNLIGEYGFARVSDLYGLLGISSNHVDDQWGWNDISTASVSHAGRSGYLLDLPPCIHMD